MRRYGKGAGTILIFSLGVQSLMIGQLLEDPHLSRLFLIIIGRLSDQFIWNDLPDEVSCTNNGRALTHAKQ